MQINIPEPAKMKVTVYGQTFDVTEPTVDQMIAFTEQTEGVGPSKQLPAMKDMATSIGVPNELLGRMRFTDFTTLIQAITGSDKKK